MTSRLGTIIDKVASFSIQQRAVSAGVGAALGAVLGPAAATLTGNKESDKDTLNRDMIAGALGGAIGGLMGPMGEALGGSAGGLVAGLFDKDKKASQPGQDLRLPVMGGTKFPTQDSVDAASKKLQQSSAEVGPQPAPTYSMMGKKAALGDAMDPMIDDPLVQYLEKISKDEAKEQPPLTGLVEGSKLDDNLPNMPLGKEENEMASLPSCPTLRMRRDSKTDVREATDELFSNSQATRKKFDDKDHTFEGFDQGVVDRILGL